MKRARPASAAVSAASTAVVVTTEPVSVGRYVLRAKLAAGGMAAVYIARLDAGRGVSRWVAVKIIHAHLAEDRHFVEMFLDEARLAAGITHPNVCSVLDYGEEDGVPYMVMEYLHGETLAAVLRKATSAEPIPRWLAARVVADAARGLHAAHDLRDGSGDPLGLVHRDVSPQNVMVLYDGLAKVMDFGVAHAHGRLAVSTSGEVKGKFAYMAPEQLASREIDRRTDVWALGVVLWEATLGRRLFAADNPGATTVNVLSMPVPRPRDIDPSYPPALEAAVMRALERAPADRHATAAELADDVESYVYSIGKPAGSAQVASWMGTAFAERRSRRELVLREGAPPLEVDVDIATAISESEVRASAARSTASAAAPTDVAAATDAAAVATAIDTEPATVSERSFRVDAPRDPIDEAPRSSRALPIALAILAFGALVALAIALVVPRLSDGSIASTTPAALGGDRATTTPRPSIAPPPTAPATSSPAASSGAAPSPATTTDAPRAPAADRATPGPSRSTSRATSGRASSSSSSRASAPSAASSATSARGATPPSPSTASTATATGTLNLLAIPVCEVFWRGRSLGRTPLFDRALPAGRHTLTLRPHGGGASRTVTVVIVAGERTRRSVNLDALR